MRRGEGPGKRGIETVHEPPQSLDSILPDTHTMVLTSSGQPRGKSHLQIPLQTQQRRDQYKQFIDVLVHRPVLKDNE